jgi:hypothetical protein
VVVGYAVVVGWAVVVGHVHPVVVLVVVGQLRPASAAPLGAASASTTDPVMRLASPSAVVRPLRLKANMGTRLP